MATEQAHQKYCSFCGAKLSLGYHFTCHICGASYCFIHMSRHDRTHPRPGEKPSPDSDLLVVGQ